MVPSSTCLPRGNKQCSDHYLCRPHALRGGLAGTVPRGGRNGFRPGVRRPRLQTRPGTLHAVWLQWGWGGGSQNLAPPCGRDRFHAHQARGYLLPWHPTGPGFQPCRLYLGPGTTSCQQKVKGSEGCYHWAGVCESSVPSHPSQPHGWVLRSQGESSGPRGG